MSSGTPTAPGKFERLVDPVLVRQAAARQAELADLRQRAQNGVGMQGNERNLSDYLFRRSLLKRPVQGGVLGALRSGNDTVTETRQRLSEGRGNVRRDVRRAGPGVSRRTQAGRDMEEAITWYRPFMSAKQSGQLLATIAELTRAGNCAEHADVATHIQAQKPSTGPLAHSASVHHRERDHEWSEIRRKGRGASADDVIIDAWADGPAVLRGDSEFAHEALDLGLSYAYSANERARVTQNMAQRRAATFSRANQNRFQGKLAALNKRRFRYPREQLWGQTNVFSANFIGASDLAFQQLGALQGGNALHHIHAVGVLRSLGSNVRTAVADAPAMVARRGGLSKKAVRERLK